MCFDWGRVFLALNVVPLFFRILYVFSISQELGPKVVMIQRMMKDLFWFVMILLVFITSYAIASEAILYPNTELSWQLLYRLPRKAYWTIYGELFLEEIEGRLYLVPVFMGVYILMTNVLLLNLLIAMFSYTFQKIHENTDIYWHFQKFGLIFEYSARPCLPPPFIVLGHLYIFFRWVGAKLGWWRKKSRTSYFKRPFEGSPKPLTKWEDIMTEKYLAKLEATGAKSVEGRVKVVMKRF
nr:hypothetical protein BaRGS_026742 [Batillaria attramentaria]